MKIEYRNMFLEAEENAKIIEGYACVFENAGIIANLDGVEYKEIIDKKAFDNVDLTNVILLYNHKHILARVTNNTLKLTVDNKGLHIKANLGKTQAGREAYNEVKEKFITGMSFGFVVEEDEYDRLTRTRRILKFKKIFEVSLSPLPAYKKTHVEARDYFITQQQQQQLQQLRKRLIVKTQI